MLRPSPNRGSRHRACSPTAENKFRLAACQSENWLHIEQAQATRASMMLRGSSLLPLQAKSTWHPRIALIRLRYPTKALIRLWHPRIVLQLQELMTHDCKCENGAIILAGLFSR